MGVKETEQPALWDEIKNNERRKTKKKIQAQGTKQTLLSAGGEGEFPTLEYS